MVKQAGGRSWDVNGDRGEVGGILARRKRASELFRVLNIIRLEVNTCLTTIDLTPAEDCQGERHDARLRWNAAKPQVMK